MSDKPADLQSVTVADAAQLMNVSERSVYMVGALMRLRPDLAAAVEAGAVSVNEAYRQATKRPKPTSWTRLIKAWNNAAPEERSRLIGHALRDVIQAGLLDDLF